MPTFNTNSMYLERDGIDLTAYYTFVRLIKPFEHRHPKPLGFSPEIAANQISVGHEIVLSLVVEKQRVQEYRQYLMENSVYDTVFDNNEQRIAGRFEILRLEDLGLSLDRHCLFDVAMRSVISQ